MRKLSEINEAMRQSKEEGVIAESDDLTTNAAEEARGN